MAEKNSPLKGIVVFIIFLGIIWFLLYGTFGRPLRERFQNSQLISPLVSTIHDLEEKILGVESQLPQIVSQSMQGSKGTYSIVIKNLKTNETYSSNEHHQYESASLYKLWVMATAYDQIQKGILKEDESIAADVAALNQKFEIASESAEMIDGTIQFTVSSALRQMITISHNYAALLLSEEIGLSKVRAFIQKHGLQKTTIGEDVPKTTAFDTALFLEKLYKGELANKENTQKMIDLLKNQKLNNKLPKYLPKNAVIAHKTGELYTFSHDAGIVYIPDNDYIIVLLSDTDYPPGAEDRIGTISKAVYEYFAGLKK